MVGLHKEQTEDAPVAEEERRRRGDAELDKLPNRQRSGPAHGISGMNRVYLAICNLIAHNALPPSAVFLLCYRDV